MVLLIVWDDIGRVSRMLNGLYPLLNLGCSWPTLKL